MASLLKLYVFEVRILLNGIDVQFNTNTEGRFPWIKTFN